MENKLFTGAEYNLYRLFMKISEDCNTSSDRRTVYSIIQQRITIYDSPQPMIALFLTPLIRFQFSCQPIVKLLLPLVDNPCTRAPKPQPINILIRFWFLLMCYEMENKLFPLLWIYFNHQSILRYIIKK